MACVVSRFIGPIALSASIDCGEIGIPVLMDTKETDVLVIDIRTSDTAFGEIRLCREGSWGMILRSVAMGVVLTNG